MQKKYVSLNIEDNNPLGENVADLNLDNANKICTTEIIFVESSFGDNISQKRR